jgi:hypothetical protein
MATSIAGLIYVFGQPFPLPERRRSVRGQARFPPRAGAAQFKRLTTFLGIRQWHHGHLLHIFPRLIGGEGSLLRVL